MYGERSRGVSKTLLCIFCRVCVSDVFISVGYLLYIFFAIYGFACVQLTHSNLGDREDTFVTRLIIISRSEVSAFRAVPIFTVAL